MKSRVPLAGYIITLLMYMFFLPTFFGTFSLQLPALSVTNVSFSRILLDSSLIIFLSISLVFSRVFFIISDLENLLITGVSRWRVTGGVFIFLVVFASPLVLIISRIILLFPLSFNVPYVILDLGTFLLYFTFIFTAMLSITLGFDKSFYFVLAVSLLNFSNLIGNPVSMGNLDSSLYLWGLIAFIVVILAALGTLIASISKEGYAPYRIARKRKSELVREPLDFTGKGPAKAPFWLGFWLSFSIAGNASSARGSRFSRVSTKRTLAVEVAFNLILSVVLVFLFHTSIGSTNGGAGDVIVIYSFVFTGLFGWGNAAMSLSQERVWLMGSTIGGKEFLKSHVLSKSALFTSLMLPSLVPLLAMAIIGHPLFLRFGLFINGTFVLLAFPASVLGIYISGFMLPEQYVRNEMPVSGTLSFFIISIPLVFAFIAGFIAYFYLLFLPVAAAVLYALAVVCLNSTRLQGRAFHSLVYRRFI